MIEKGDLPAPDVFFHVPARVAIHYGVIPLSLKEGVLHLLASPALSKTQKEELRVVLGRELAWEFAPREVIEKRAMEIYGVGAGTIEALTQGENSDSRMAEPASETDERDEFGMVRLVHELLANAISSRASDIHFEPFEQWFRVRYRIDGILEEAKVSAHIRQLAGQLVSCVKIMAKLDIGEKRLPQDGRFRVKVQGEEFDLRVSVLPSAHGESVVVRILGALSLLDFSGLGLSKETVTQMQKMLLAPHGVFLVTGPTGSGKTTTLYSCLQFLNRSGRKIITVEDPIEYKIPGIIQIQVQPKIGLTFASVLRSMLRHDPDVLMVGEMRDQETAHMALRAALTGHLVLSTLHTNDAPSAVTRLFDLGLEPYLVAESLRGVLAQRLVRKLCDCLGPRARVEREAPCPACNGTGFFGRSALSEMLEITETFRELLVREKTGFSLRDEALKSGMKSLREDGIEKAQLNLTTEEEIQRVLGCSVSLKVKSAVV